MGRETETAEILHQCNTCGVVKPMAEMIALRRRADKSLYIRPKCKDCHNSAERGHRREYKREYLRKWRKRNKALNDSYWKDNDRVREQAAKRAKARFDANHEAILIQGRMGRRGMNVTLDEAKELLGKYGRCYPSRVGLTKKGLKECERIRSRMRSRSESRRMPTSFEIRLMVYEDDDGDYVFVIPPDKQPVPYQAASKRLKEFHAGPYRDRAEQTDAKEKRRLGSKDRSSPVSGRPDEGAGREMGTRPT